MRNLVWRRRNNSKFLLFVLAGLVITNIAVLLDVPFIRPIMGFIVFTFVIGFLILYIFKINDLDITKIICLSIGISISCLMLTGYFINLIGPFAGLSKPIALIPLLIVLDLLFLVVIAIIFVRNKNDLVLSRHIFRQLSREIFSPSILFLILIFIMSILGGLFVRYYTGSLFSIILVLLVSVFVALVVLGKLVPVTHFPIAIFIIGLSLIINRTLTSPNIFGVDIHYEYYYAQLVQNNSLWDSSIDSSAINSMLSTVLLPSEYSILLNLDTIFVYKIIFPIIFAIVPVVLYKIFSSQFNEKIAFLSSFFFMSFVSFYTIMSWLPRQQIAELFLTLFVLVIVNNKITGFSKRFLIVLFILSLVVSHYGTTYIFLIYILFISILFFIQKQNDVIVKPSFAVFSIVAALFWYLTTANSAPFISLVNIGKNIFDAVMVDLFDPNKVDPDVAKALGSGLLSQPFWHAIWRFWQIITQVLISLGVIFSILKRKKFKLNNEYFAFSIFSLFIILCSIVVPYFASSLNMNRIYSLTLIFLSPFLVIGAESIIHLISIFLKNNVIKKPKFAYLVAGLVIIPYFLLNTSTIYEITEKPANLKIDFNKHKNEHAYNSTYFDWSYFITLPVTERDVVSCKWLSDKVAKDSIFLADKQVVHELSGYGLISPEETFELNLDSIYRLKLKVGINWYVYFGCQNTWKDTYITSNSEQVASYTENSLQEVIQALDTNHLIYTNGGSQLWK